MKRISAAIAAIVMLFALLCGCDNSDHYSTPYEDSIVSGNQQTSSKNEVSAPPVEEGEYTMVCSFLQSAVYLLGEEIAMDSQWDMKSWYDFTAEKTEKGLRLDFTIARRSYVYSYNGVSTVVFDTADESTKSADTQIYFDLIGHGFTVDFESNYKISAVGGTKKLYSEVEGSEYLLGEAEIRAVAEELLLSLPEVVTNTTSVTHSQTVDAKTEMEMKYDVSRISDSLITFKMTPLSQYGYPEGETGDGFTIEYTGAADYSGTLNIKATDRLTQSSSNKIIYYSVMNVTPDNGSSYSMDGMTTVTDSCEVERKN